MSLSRNLRKLAKSTILKAPFECRHYELSLISSMDDEPAVPSQRLIDVSMKAVQAAGGIQLPEVSARVQNPPYWPDVWPGEHYRLLAGLIDILQPKLVVEIGTYTGLSALAMAARLKSGAKLVTYDILPWRTIGHTHLREEDFATGTIEQRICDLADPKVFAEQESLLQQADLIFVDGPKNVTFEEQFLKNLGRSRLPKQPLLVFDDIRLWNMLHIWRAINRPKLDLTSFGHWSGTGLVEWTDIAQTGRAAKAA
ncbi:MAG: class I SAM-dependent methyltransferase [Planctomycetaceae bacterium]